MKRIWFPDQEKWDYMPLRWGLGYLSEEDVREILGARNPVSGNGELPICKKIYTTRTHELEGEYYVVHGSRFKAKPVEPMIEFVVSTSCKLNLKTGHVTNNDRDFWSTVILGRNGLTFAELDLGNRGATFEQLRDELLRHYKNAAIETPFYVSSLERL